MKKHDHPDLSFLQVDLRLIGVLLILFAVTFCFLAQPGLLVPLVLAVLFFLLFCRSYRSLFALALIFLVLQSANLQMRGADHYFSSEKRQWVAHVVAPTSLDHEYLVKVKPVDSSVFQLPAEAKVKLRHSDLSPGDLLTLTAGMEYSKFGFKLSDPQKVKVDSEASSHFLAHEYISSGLLKHGDPSDVGLFLGITHGDDSLIERQDRNNYRTVGISHMTAVSGSNIALVAAATFTCLALATGRRSTALTGTIVITFLYCIFVGLDGSVVRAFAFALIAFFAALRGSSKNGFALCASALSLLLLCNPLLLWNVGFVLSAATTLGLVLVCPSLTYLISLKGGETLATFLSINTVAHLVSLPLSAFYFEKIYTYSFLANLLVAPLVPVILALGVGYLLFYILYNVDFSLLYHLAEPLVKLIRIISEYLAGLTGSELTIHHTYLLFPLLATSVSLSCIIVRAARRSASQTPEPLIFI